MSADSPPSVETRYKELIEDARAIGDRRDNLNSLLVSILSLIAGAEGFILITFPGTFVGLATSLVSTYFGLRLCKIWEDAIGSFKILLDFRYFVLKFWEDKYKFPSLIRYYSSEDILYGPVKNATELTEATPEKLLGKAATFVSIYSALPKFIRPIFYSLTILQAFAFVYLTLYPYLSNVFHWPMLFYLKF